LLLIAIDNFSFWGEVNYLLKLLIIILESIYYGISLLINLWYLFVRFFIILSFLLFYYLSI